MGRATGRREKPARLWTITLAAGRATKIDVAFTAPRGTGVNEDAPFRVVWIETAGLVKTPDPVRGKGAAFKGGFAFDVEPAPGASSGRLAGVLDLVICDVATHRVCVPIRRTVTAKIEVAKTAPEARAAIALPEAK